MPQLSQTCFDNAEAAQILDVKEKTVSKLIEAGLKPEGRGNKWTPRQILALAAKVHTRRAGATKAASDAAFEFLSRFTWHETQVKYKAGNCGYVQLIGKHCLPKLVTASHAFSPSALRKATEAGMPYVIFDVGYWFDRIRRAVWSQQRIALRERARVQAEEGQPV